MLDSAADKWSRDGSRADLRAAGAVSLATAAVVACQVVAVTAGDQSGAIANACLIVVLAAAASSERPSESSRTAYLVLSLLPLLALARVAMPQNSIPNNLWELVVAAPLVAGSVVLVAIVDRGVVRDAHTRLPLRRQLAVASVGAPAGLLAFGVAHGVREGADGSGVAAATILVLSMAGIFDELLFRGLLQLSLARIYGQGAFIVAGLLYTAMLLGNPAATVVAGGLLGLGFGFLVARSRALLAVAVAHGTANVVWLVLARNPF
jgi:membrane protease YdiL (CAAX protease family)